MIPAVNTARAALLVLSICLISSPVSSQHKASQADLPAFLACMAPGETCDPHFTYTPGPHGPDHWGGECNTGQVQSPVNIERAQSADLPRIEFGYKPTGLDILNDCNHWTIKINYGAGSGIKIGNESYTLKQFHFHEPSEEAIKGEHQAMVIHLVHESSDGKTLAVVAALVKVGEENPLIKTLWANIPPPGDEGHHPDIHINASDLLPPDQGYYELSGSLTTPPCTQGVRWFVLKTPIELSQAQIDEYKKHYHNTARPLQPLNGRPVEQTR